MKANFLCLLEGLRRIVQVVIINKLIMLMTGSGVPGNRL